MTPVPKSPNPPAAATSAVHEAIRRRAEEIYVRNGKIPGRDLENWAQAEREILREAAPPRTACTRTLIVLRRPARTWRGDSVTRRWAGSGAAHEAEVVPAGRTTTDTALAPGQAVTRSTSAPAGEVVAPPRTTAA